jgi:hypothetical protein
MKKPTTRAAALMIGVILAACSTPVAAVPSWTYAPPSASFLPVVVPAATPEPSTSPGPSVASMRPVEKAHQVVPTPRPTPRPTPKPKRRFVKPTSGGIRGVATWYCLPGRSRCTHGFPADGAYAAAGPELRAALGNWRGRAVWVNGVRVKLIDFCACSGDHVIDVYHATWRTIPHPDSVVIRW